MGTYLPGLNFPIYSGWTQYSPVIPKLYWDVYSAEQRMKQLCLSYDKVEHYLDYIADLMNQWNIDFTEDMEKEFAELWNAVDNGLENAVHDWIQKNLSYIFETVVRQIFFGLTLDGYFVAYIPDSWDDIEFDTGMIYGTEQYGRLILRYDVDSPHDVDQGQEITPSDVSTILEMLNQNQIDIRRLNKNNFTPIVKDEGDI